jgi:hypothetical protein
VRSVLVGTLLLLSPISSFPMWAQEDTHSEQPQSEFFSGIVTELAADKIMVLKTVLGKNSDTRAFLITKETQVEGKLRVKARVTVRYAHEEDSNRALRIIVRNSQKK